jgi:hypothetical protein
VRSALFVPPSRVASLATCWTLAAATLLAVLDPENLRAPIAGPGARRFEFSGRGRLQCRGERKIQGRSVSIMACHANLGYDALQFPKFPRPRRGNNKRWGHGKKRGTFGR